MPHQRAPPPPRPFQYAAEKTHVICCLSRCQELVLVARVKAWLIM